MPGIHCPGWRLKQILVAIKRLLNMHMDMQGMEEYGLCARRYVMVLASCSAQTLWTKEPILPLYCSMNYPMASVRDIGSRNARA